MNAYWRAANYLSVGQIYLKDNPLLDRPLSIDDIKPRLLGHWGTTSGLNFIYTHLNRLIVECDLNMIYIIGPGHGGPGIVAHTYLDVVRRVPRLAGIADRASQRFSEAIQRHKLYVSEHGEDLPEVRNWSWTLS
jgi:phosphoketolase